MIKGGNDMDSLIKRCEVTELEWISKDELIIKVKISGVRFKGLLASVEG